MKTVSRALLAVIAVATVATADTSPGSFVAPLPNGEGSFLLSVSADGTSLEYRIAGSFRTDRIFAAHVHAGGDESSPTIATLQGPFLPAGGGGEAQAGTIRDSDVGGPLAGRGVAGLLAELRAGAISIHLVLADPGGGPPVLIGDGVELFGKFEAR